MPENTVRQLREEPEEKNVAAGVSLVVTLPGGRQISFQTGYEGDESDAVINARLDRTMRFADRLRAINEIPELEDELEQHETTMARFLEDQAAIVERYEVAQAQRQVERQTRERDAQSRWETSGKRGGFKAEGATKRDLDLISGEMTRAEAEFKQNRDIAQKTHERYVQEIETRKAKIAKAKALAEG